MIRSFTILLLFISSVSFAQYLYQPDLTIEVIDEKQLVNPWAGGINSAQIGKLDLNLDGIEDLVVFDRTSNKLSTFLNIDSQYLYSPEYEFSFPENIEGWIIFADYNCDGKNDIFTHTLFGIKVYENISDTKLEWRKVADPLYTTGTSGDFNLQVNVTDIPAISDVDNDGDLDILVYNFAIGGFIRYHKNFSVENEGNCGLQFTRVSMQWGQFEECECDYFAFDGNSCENLEIGGRILHAGGKSMLLVDLNGDQVKDLLMSQEDCNKLYYLENKGTTDLAYMNSFQMNFPNEQPAHFERFPAAFYEDVTFDESKDLMVSPNLPNDPLYTIDFKNSVWLYRNSGSDQNPQLNFMKSDFLQDEMIDEGWMAKPFFVDYNRDGKTDMFIAANGVEVEGFFYGGISYYSNIGTSRQPKFQKENPDFMNLSSKKWVDIQPMFVDLNKDGALDLVIPGRIKSSSRANIYYLINQSDEGDYNFDPNDLRQLDFDKYFSGDNIYFYDVNKDGNLDILIGKSTGRIEFYQNTGNLMFNLVSSNFAGIDDNYTRRAPSFVINDFDQNGKDEMAVLDNSGVLRIIENFNISQRIEHLQTYFNKLEEREDTARLGQYNQLATVSLNPNELPHLAIGSIQGGINLLKNIKEIGSLDGEKIVLEVYPNPVSGSIGRESTFVKIKVSMDARIDVVSVLGQVIFSKTVKKGETTKLDSRLLSQGIYIVRAYASKKQSTAKRFVVLN